ncbi:MAG: Hydrogenase-4 component B [Verrucomicrobia bacterium ADurb.Bin345]|nr:MAG: Hydrogenase-4 component B [Verrucomicrobia bacterium ADurb.Bin345]
MTSETILYGLVLLPLFGGLAAFALRSDRLRRALLLLVAFGHLALALMALRARPAPVLNGWIALDDAGLLFLLVTSILFAAAAVYAQGYLRSESRPAHRDPEESFLFDNAPEAVFTGCLLLFLGTMTLVEVSRHLGLVWVAVEATTLASAPLIYFHRHHRSLEAVWKYLMICSVGIALALLGLFFLVSVEFAPSLQLDHILRDAARLPAPWLKAAFIFMLVGYGTKMGLAPMHTWLPDAHSEAPSLVSALLSGSLLNCAFLALWRMVQVCTAAGLGDFVRDLLLALGLVSLGMAALFIVQQRDFKRLLAYSSIENMGIMAIGAALGATGAAGAFLHALNHSLIKGALFFVAGSLLALYGTRATDAVRGLSRRAPAVARLWLLGLLAIGGMPPFGAFASKFIVVRSAIVQGHAAVAAAFLLLVFVVFVGLSGVALRMILGPPSEPKSESRAALSPAWIVPPAVLLLLSLVLGVCIPAFLERIIQGAAGITGVWP